MKITKKTLIEDLITEYPDSVSYMMRQGIRCIKCGEPTWGTIEQAAIEKGFSEESINRIVEELANLYKKKDE